MINDKQGTGYSTGWRKTIGDLKRCLSKIVQSLSRVQTHLAQQKKKLFRCPHRQSWNKGTMQYLAEWIVHSFSFWSIYILSISCFATNFCTHIPLYCKIPEQGKGTVDHLLPLGDWFVPLPVGVGWGCLMPMENPIS